MLETLERVLNHGWMSSLVSLASILIAVVVYLRSRHRPAIAYQIQSVRLLRAGGGTSDNDPQSKPPLPYRNLPEGIEVLFRGTKLDQLVRSTIILWNPGNQTFRRADIVESDTLRIELASGRVLSATVTSVTRPVNHFAVMTHQEGPLVASMTFDFLDPGDGAAVVASAHVRFTSYANRYQTRPAEGSAGH